MAAQKGKGHFIPDRTKRYAVVEKPTAGDLKDQITRVFDQELGWDDAFKLKNELAAKRVTKFATIIEMPPLEHKSEASEPVSMASIMIPDEQPVAKADWIAREIVVDEKFDDGELDAIDRAVQDAETIAASEAAARDSASAPNDDAQ